MKQRITILAFMLCGIICFSQENETGALLKKANEVLYDDPAQAIKIGDYLLQNSDNPKMKSETALLIAKGYLINGYYTKVIENAELSLAEAKTANLPEDIFPAALLTAETYAYLDLTEISNKFLKEAETAAGNDILLKRQLESYRLFVSTQTSANVRSSFLKKIPPDEMIRHLFITKGTPLQLTAVAFQKSGQLDSAAVYFEKNLQDISKNKRGIFWQMLEYINYGDYWLAKKDFAKATALFEEASNREKVIRNSYYGKTIYQKLSAASLALSDKARFQIYRQKAAVAESNDGTQVTQATNVAFDLLQMKKAYKTQKAENIQQNIALALGISAIIVLLLWLLVKWLFATRIQYTQDIVNYLKLIKNIEQKHEPAMKPAVKNLSIPKETEDAILSKLEKFESGIKYLNNDISLAQMASMFETNTKYLSEVINKYKRKNFNAYINGLRIMHIVDKLKSDPKYLHYKVSYLAEECGFSSHSMFSSAFKSATGITPNVFIQFLSEDHPAEKIQLAES